MTTTMKIIRGLGQCEVKQISTQSIGELCKFSQDIYEVIPDTPVKMYLDFDYNCDHDFDVYNLDTAEEIKKLLHYYINLVFTQKYNITPIIKTSSSH